MTSEGARVVGVVGTVIVGLAVRSVVGAGRGTDIRLSKLRPKEPAVREME